MVINGNLNTFSDFSGSFGELRKRIANETAGEKRGEDVPYMEFLSQLKPDYARVWRDIAFGYAMLVATLAVVVIAQSVGLQFVIAGLLGAVSIGFWIAYIQLFIHEAAHFNLAAEKNRSDQLGDRWIAWMVGTSVSAYRSVHLQHHRALGDIDDSEHTYFFPLNLAFLIKGLFGIRVFEVVLSRLSFSKNQTATSTENEAASVSKLAVTAALDSKLPILKALLFHGGIVTASFLLGYWGITIAWLLGVSTFFPFFGAIRQLLEHRSENADSQTDYSKVPHGALTRMFSDNILDRTLGGAGFNRHLLHHWEPRVSYTNLAELEAYLRNTSAGPIIEARKSTYASTALRLLSLN